MDLPILTRAELDLDRCPDCGEVHPEAMEMRARCHPRAGMRVVYERGAGVLHFHCAKCREPIALIAVAETLSEVPADVVRH